MTFVTAKNPKKRAAKQYKKPKKTTLNFTTAKITTTENTTTNKPKTITPNGTERDQNPKEFKSNHSS